MAFNGTWQKKLKAARELAMSRRELGTDGHKLAEVRPCGMRSTVKVVDAADRKLIDDEIAARAGRAQS